MQNQRPVAPNASLLARATCAVAAASALALAGCSDPVGDKPRATVSEAKAPAAAPAGESDTPKDLVRYAFTQDGSAIGFVGAKVTGKHDGGFKAFSGTVEATAGKLEGAKVDVEIDMASIFTDTERLTGHLKSADFFEVEKFPKSRFTSTSITRNDDGTSTVTGNLTLHGVTKQISFPARISVEGDTATAKAEFGINRKDFGIVYPGKPDDLIKDEVLLKLDVSAKRR